MEKDRFKFRFWDKEQSIYLNEEINDINVDYDVKLQKFIFKCFFDEDFDDNYPLYEDWEDNIIIEQFTGLKDKHGNPIFEGDYLEIRNPSGTVNMRVEVFFSKGSFMIGDPDKQNHYLRMLGDEGWEYQIIGNIHENQEEKIDG